MGNEDETARLGRCPCVAVYEGLIVLDEAA